MNLVVRVLLILGLLFVALFCAVGFIAAFGAPSTPQRVAFLVLFGAGGGVSMLTALRLALPNFK
jgi:hypothetical protein